jgi:hypothetical protein
MNAPFNPWPEEAWSETLEQDRFCRELSIYQQRVRLRTRLSRPKMEEHMARACELYGVTMEELKGPSRKGKLSLARHYVFYHARMNSSAPSLSFIARKIGRCHHTSVIYGAGAHAIRHGLPFKWDMDQPRLNAIKYEGPEPQ